MKKLHEINNSFIDEPNIIFERTDWFTVYITFVFKHFWHIIYGFLNMMMGIFQFTLYSNVLTQSLCLLDHQGRDYFTSTIIRRCNDPWAITLFLLILIIILPLSYEFNIMKVFLSLVGYMFQNSHIQKIIISFQFCSILESL